MDVFDFYHTKIDVFYIHSGPGPGAAGRTQGRGRTRARGQDPRSRAGPGAAAGPSTCTEIVIFTGVLRETTPFQSVQDSAHPYLVFDSDSGPLEWSHGTLLALRLGAHFLRITPRGMHVSQHMALDISTHHDFHRTDCKPSRTALCEESDSRMLFFSTGAVDLPDDWRTLYQNEFVQRFPNGSSCSSDYTGRVIRTVDTQYELSLCDLMDSNLDIVLDTQTAKVYWRQDSTWALDYLFVAVLAVYLISVISHNMATAMTHETSQVRFLWFPRRHVENLVVAVVLLYTLVSVLLRHCVLLTSGDAALLWHLMILSGVYLVVNVTAGCSRGAVAGSRENRHNVSMFTMCLLLLLLRVYQTMDMPYLPVLVFLFGSRFVYKLVGLFMCWDRSDYVLLIGDAFVFASLMGNAVWVSQSHAVQAGALQAVILVSSWLTGIFMHLYSAVYGDMYSEP